MRWYPLLKGKTLSLAKAWRCLAPPSLRQGCFLRKSPLLPSKERKHILEMYGDLKRIRRYYWERNVDIINASYNVSAPKAGHCQDAAGS